MSRKFDRAFQVSVRVREILESEEAMAHLLRKIFRPRPAFMPGFIWRIFLWIVVKPPKKT